MLRLYTAPVTTRKQASDATGGATAPVGGTTPSLAGPREASGTPPRNGTIRPRSTDTGNGNGERRLDNPIRENPARSPEVQRRRMRWSRQDNLDLMRAYFFVTNAGQDKTNYRVRLHERWLQVRPDFRREPQQLSDQVRSVTRRKVLSEAEIEQLKAEARQQAPQENIEPNIDRRRTMLVPRRSTIFEIVPEEIPAEIENTLKANKLKYEGVPFENRPILPKLRYSKTAHETVRQTNRAINEELAACLTLEETCHLIYCAALTVLELLGTPFKHPRINSDTGKNTEPPWLKRIQNKINNFRREIGQIHTYLNSHEQTTRLQNIMNKLYKKNKYKYQLSEKKRTLTAYMEDLKQKIKMLGSRIRRYQERVARYKENRLFQQNQKQFYRNLTSKPTNSYTEKPAGQNEMYRYWSQLWGNTKEHDREAYWIAKEEERMTHIQEMGEVFIVPKDVEDTTKKLANWKAPGIDKIHAYWWKNFTYVHQTLANQFNEAINDPKKLPTFFTKGITYLLPKNEKIGNPENYRPITCLPIAYKILTSIFEHKITLHLKEKLPLAWQQNGCRAKARGSKEWLILDEVVTNHAKQKKRNLSVAWIDYRKAFDSVPHSWLLQALEIYKINRRLIETLRKIMANWQTYLNVNVGGVQYTTDGVKINRGIFQGDSLSPLWFCVALNPLSNLLETSNYGYILSRRPSTKISHLLFMDDLKLYGTNAEQLTALLELVSSFSRAIAMEFGLEKCAFVHIKAGKIQESENITLMDHKQFAPLPPEDKYKYLGIQQTINIDHKHAKELAETTLKKRLQLVLRSHLYARSKISAINSWVLPSVMYSFGIVKWSPTDLENLDRLIRTSLTKERLHHPNASINRLYLPRGKGGRGLRNLKEAHNKECHKLFTYLKAVAHPTYRAITSMDTSFSPLKLASDEASVKENKDYYIEIEETWKNKELHGRYAAVLSGPEVDKEMSTLYLTNGALMAETEGFLQAIQDQVICTRNYRRFILRQEILSDRCRLCQEKPETIQHLLAGCSYLAPRDHKKRHDDVAKVFHQAICIKYGLLDEHVAYYKYQPRDHMENNKAKVYWDKLIITDKTVTHNKPDILVIDKEENSAKIIDVTIPGDHNLKEARTQKIHKYLDLAHELKDLYQLQQVTIHPLVISGTGLVEAHLKKEVQGLKLMDIKRIVLTAQQATILGTCRTVRRALTHD